MCDEIECENHQFNRVFVLLETAATTQLFKAKRRCSDRLPCPCLLWLEEDGHRGTVETRQKDKIDDIVNGFIYVSSKIKDEAGRIGDISGLRDQKKSEDLGTDSHFVWS